MVVKKKEVMQKVLVYCGPPGLHKGYVEAFVYGDFAVHQTPWSGKNWTISHIPTGQDITANKIDSLGRKKSTMKKFASLLGSHNFTDVTDEENVSALRMNILSCMELMKNSG